LRLRPHSADSTMLRLWPTGSSVGIAPVDYDPVVLLKPFGPRLAADALPSEDSPMGLQVRPIAKSREPRRSRVGQVRSGLSAGGGRIRTLGPRPTDLRYRLIRSV